MSTWTWRVMLPAVVGLMGAGCPGPDPVRPVPDCSEDTLATQPPLDAVDFVAVGPMGAVDALRGPLRPGRAVSLFARPQDPRLPLGDPARVPVVAPAPFWIQRVWRVVDFNANRPVQFGVDARSCKQVTWTLEHLLSLSPELARYIDDPQVGVLNCTTLDDGFSTRCEAAVSDLVVAAGTELGQTGNWFSKALGVSVVDLRSPLVGFANGQTAHSTCPLDEFQPSVADALRALPSAPDGRRRTAPPLCGEFMQDVVGTAAGNWSSSQGDLSLVHDNVDPGIGVISFNQAFMPGEVWRFVSGTSGTVNRDFRQVAPDGTLYCYDASAGGDVPGIVLVQLSSIGTLTYEPQPASGCGTGPWAMTASASVFSR